MTLAAVTEAKSVTETVAYIVVRDSVFGALLILALFALYLLTVQLLRIQEKRVTDLQKLNERVEAREDSTRRLVDKMTEAFQQVKSSLDTLSKVGDKQAEATDSNTEVLRKVEGTLDSVIREHARTAAHVAGYRRLTPTNESLPPKKGG
jgi:biopolymer transport protein ExbB/TolQ